MQTPLDADANPNGALKFVWIQLILLKLKTYY